MTKEYRPRVDIDEAILHKIRELHPNLLITKLVNDLLFNFILVSMETDIPNALHPVLLKKVAEITLTEIE